MVFPLSRMITQAVPVTTQALNRLLPMTAAASTSLMRLRPLAGRQFSILSKKPTGQEGKEKAATKKEEARSVEAQVFPFGSLFDDPFFAPFSSLMRPFNSPIGSIFRDFFPDLEPMSWVNRPATTGLAAPSVKLDVSETDKAFTIKADIPSGVKKEDVKVKIEDQTLTISGTRKEELEEKDKQGEVRRAERKFGSFQRVLRLPDNIKSEEIEASLSDGVLSINIPKTKVESKANEIPIK